MTKTRQFLSTCYGYPSTTEVPPCCQAATKKLTFSTTSVLLLLNVPLSLSRGTVFRRQKNPRRGYRPKIAGILFVCNEPEGKYYTVPDCRLVIETRRRIFFSVGPDIGSGADVIIYFGGLWLHLGLGVLYAYVCIIFASRVHLGFKS